MIKIELENLKIDSIAKDDFDALIVLVSPESKLAETKLGRFISTAIKTGELNDKSGSLVCYQSALTQAKILSVNYLKNVTATKVEAVLLAAYNSVKVSRPKKIAVVCEFDANSKIIAAATKSISSSTYVYTTTKPNADGRLVKKVIFSFTNEKEVKETFRRAVATVVGVEFAKEWANRPANYCTPTLLAEAAQDLAKGNLKCEVLDLKAVEKIGMRSFISVAKGSDEPLKFIIFKYEGADDGGAPIALIGKGITFDSGGISLKPGGRMDEMKYDMGGAASVLGTFKALSILKPKINVVGLIPACENMPSGKAVKPGDVITSLDGTTIEILNTDAEGRLILCDALSYAQSTFKPKLMIDMATLTGACIVALGHLRSGLFSNDEALGAELAACGEDTHDLCWQLPLDDEYSEGLKSNFADLANIGSAGLAGTVVAAVFLKHFVKNTAWAHLDIAGTAWNGPGNKGATGRPVSLLVDFICKRAEQKQCCKIAFK